MNKFINLSVKSEENNQRVDVFISKKIKDFSKIKFYSRRFFLDVELISFYHKKRKKIKNIPTSYSLPKNSTIKLFSLKNIEIILEFIKIVFLVKFKS